MKLFFCAMVGPGSLENLKELLEPIKQYFDGICVVLHDARGSKEDEYLESIKGEGAVIHLPFSKRHAFSRNHFLWCGGIPEGSWICMADHLERINPSFAANLRNMIAGFETQGINTCFYYNKAFIYQQHESLEFSGSPHEGLRRNDGQMRAIELSTYFPVESDVRYSVRHLKRDMPFSWVDHYLKYYVSYPWGSNHCLLGNCDRPWEGTEMEIFQRREAVRLTFRDEMRRRGVPLTCAALKDYWLSHPLDDKMRYYLNKDKILQDAWRLYVQKDETVNDNHHWKDLKVIS